MHNIDQTQGDGDNNDGEIPRLFDLTKNDVDGFTGVIGALGVVVIAAGTEVPIVSGVASTAANIVSLAITYDAWMDFIENPNPMPSDVASLALNTGNTAMGFLWDYWAFPAAIIGAFDLSGGFDKWYNKLDDNVTH